VQLSAEPLGRTMEAALESAKVIVFWCVLAGAVVYDTLLVLSIAKPHLRFWPPPPSPSWRHNVTRVAGPLGPLSLAGILGLGALDWNTGFWPHWSSVPIGGFLFLSGGAFALWGFFGLGLTASQGLGGPLRARGAYRYSRNPQYVGTVIGFFGYALACNSTLALAALVVWSPWYLLAPFAEEPWCRDHLGPAYEQYATHVRRYL
jgi:protein-S-isoprenylcysteine O-methyltransferase Ste14